MNRSRRTLVLTLLAALALLCLLPGLLWLGLDAMYGRQLQREYARLRAEGAPPYALA